MAQQIVLLPAASPAQAIATGYHPVLMPCTNLIPVGTASGSMLLVNGQATHISPTHHQHHTQQVLVQQQPAQYIAQALTPSQQQQQQQQHEYCPQQFAQLLPTDGQFVSILNADQLVATAAVVPQQQQLISISWQTDGDTVNLVPGQQQVTPSWATHNGQQQFVASMDINDFLASTLASVEDNSDKLSDQIQAKQWYKDSNIANRALRALKTAPDSIQSTASSANVSLASVVITEQPRHSQSSQRLLRRHCGSNETWRMVAS